jgi:hypothetical protein
MTNLKAMFMLNAALTPRLPEKTGGVIQCRYRNETDLVQVLAISHPQWCFVKLLRPGQALQFMAPSDALLIVKTGLTPSPPDTTTIACQQLVSGPSVSAPIVDDSIVGDRPKAIGKPDRANHRLMDFTETLWGTT